MCANVICQYRNKQVGELAFGRVKWRAVLKKGVEQLNQVAVETMSSDSKGKRLRTLHLILALPSNAETVGESVDPECLHSHQRKCSQK